MSSALLMTSNTVRCDILKVMSIHTQLESSIRRRQADPRCYSSCGRKQKKLNNLAAIEYNFITCKVCNATGHIRSRVVNYGSIKRIELKL